MLFRSTTTFALARCCDTLLFDTDDDDDDDDDCKAVQNGGASRLVILSLLLLDCDLVVVGTAVGVSLLLMVSLTVCRHCCCIAGVSSFFSSRRPSFVEIAFSTVDDAACDGVAVIVVRARSCSSV